MVNKAEMIIIKFIDGEVYKIKNFGCVNIAFQQGDQFFRIEQDQGIIKLFRADQIKYIDWK